MFSIDSILLFFRTYLAIFCVKDVIEIIFFIVSLRAIFIWIDRDHTKKLLPATYALLLLCCLASWFNLATITVALILYMPCIMMIFILFHQESLQRNFVATKTITPASTKKMTDWIPLLIRTTLQAKSYNKSMICIIEHHESLSAFMHTSHSISAPINDHLLSLIIENASYDQTKLVWVQHTGTLVAYNTHLTMQQHPLWQAEHMSYSQPIPSLMVLTKKTDAIILMSSPSSHGLTIIAQGKLVENIASHTAISIIKQYLHYSSQEAKQGEQNLYEANQSQKRTHEQITP